MLEETQTPISQDLQEKVGALKALATSHALLNQGLFPVSKARMVEMACEFLANLHEQLLAEAQAHPEADRVPELVKLKGEAKNG